jgi:hypothetical protein
VKSTLDPYHAELLERERRQEAEACSEIRAYVAGGFAWEAASYAVFLGLSDEAVRALNDLWRGGAISIDQLRDAIRRFGSRTSHPCGALVSVLG